MSNQKRDCILLFAKYPEKGKVKKRLAGYLGEESTVELYKNFILDSLSTIKASHVECVVCVYPPETKEAFATWLGNDYSYLSQEGVDLGERMKNSFINAFARNYQRVITMGSDIPDLPLHVIEDAFSHLSTEDVVIGPSTDGGYYLIGFRHTTFLPEAFKELPWGTSTVCEETIHLLKRSGYSLYLLPEWSDIDTYEEVLKLMERSKHTPFRNSHTLSFLLHCSGAAR